MRAINGRRGVITPHTHTHTQLAGLRSYPTAPFETRQNESNSTQGRTPPRDDDSSDRVICVGARAGGRPRVPMTVFSGEFT